MNQNEKFNIFGKYLSARDRTLTSSELSFNSGQILMQILPVNYIWHLSVCLSAVCREVLCKSHKVVFCLFCEVWRVSFCFGFGQFLKCKQAVVKIKQHFYCLASELGLMVTWWSAGPAIKGTLVWYPDVSHGNFYKHVTECMFTVWYRHAVHGFVASPCCQAVISTKFVFVIVCFYFHMSKWNSVLVK